MGLFCRYIKETNLVLIISKSKSRSVMPNFIRSENEADFYRTSGAVVFTLGGGDGTVLQRIIWEPS